MKKMRRIKIGDKYKYIALKRKQIGEEDKVYYKTYGKISILGKWQTSLFFDKVLDSEEVGKRLFYFYNPFDALGGETFGAIIPSGLTEEKIKELISTKWNQDRNCVYYFDTLKELEQFIEKNTPVLRKKLLKKYKNTSIMDVPLGDLEKLGIPTGIIG
jgi:hypothetical protein